MEMATSRHDGSDRRLVEAWLRGDGDATQTLVRRILPQVRKVLYRVLGPDPAYEDHVQETMCQIFRSLPRFRGEASLETWATHVAVNTARQVIRKRRREMGTVELDGSSPAQDPSPERTAEVSEQFRALYRLLERLDEDKRLALALHELAGMTVSEVARVTGVPLSTAKSRIWYGRKELLRLALADPVLGSLVDVPSEPESGEDGG